MARGAIDWRVPGIVITSAARNLLLLPVTLARKQQIPHGLRLFVMTTAEIAKSDITFAASRI